MSWLSPSVSSAVSLKSITSYIKMWFSLCVFYAWLCLKNIWWHFAYPLWMSTALRWAKLTNRATNWTHQWESILTAVMATHPQVHQPSFCPSLLLWWVIAVLHQLLDMTLFTMIHLLNLSFRQLSKSLGNCASCFKSSENKKVRFVLQ